MAVNSVSFSQAMRSASSAQQYLRSGNISESERAQLVIKWGADKVEKWSTVDSTEYVIEDDAIANAKDAGSNAAAESTGYDGSKDHGAWVDVAGGAVSAGAAGLMGTIGSKLTAKTGANWANRIATNEIGKKSAQKAANKISNKAINEAGSRATNKTGEEAVKDKAARNVGAWVAATLAAAVATKYLKEKPNKEQFEAIMHIQDNELPQGVNSLAEAENNMVEATEYVAELSEEAEGLNEDANDRMEEDKTLFDSYRNQYIALKEKAESGTSLSVDEKALMEKLAPLMAELGENIETVQEETQTNVEDLYGQIGDMQEAYDESAETIAEVQGMTDYAEGFDESTRTMTTVEAVGQGLNAASAASAVTKLVSTNLFGINTPFIALGTYAGIVSTDAVVEQLNMGKGISNEIEARQNVQDLTDVSFENYNTELDNFAGYNEFVEDLEMEVPEDLEMPEAPAVTSTPTGQDGQNPDPFVAAMSGDDTRKNVPYSPLTAGNNGTQGDDGNNKNITSTNDNSKTTDTQSNKEDEKDPTKKKGEVDK